MDIQKINQLIELINARMYASVKKLAVMENNFEFEFIIVEAHQVRVVSRIAGEEYTFIDNHAAAPE